ncbi:G kinase-anchoring protein 1-like isoform X1 [Maniola hyperantus]|uniref:G kinase-anchoring protein 1-like isoform X1 n=1 Tax=Aphantopus hyperantus TaxID=2795564 RepID=UPI001567EEF8|nr:G kinase-anchoring protein 1-like isoform X1 [Maniola hyperantus]
MAALVVQSRFAGLKIEDEDHSGNDNQKSKKNKANPSKKLDSAKKTKTSNNKPQPVPASKKRKQKPVEATSEQWEMWKQKDEEIVDGNFENQLQEAILLSKLDFEEKKDVYKAMKKEAEFEKKLEEQSRSGNKKQKKKNVMSLEQFNDMVTHGDEPNFTNITSEICPEEEPKQPDKDTKFFDRIQTETKNELLKDNIIVRVLNQRLPDEVLTRLQFAEALEKKDKEISALKQQITSLKDELFTVKSRNKKLCNILGQGEMKDKAEILVEVERLRGVQSELTAELASLHTDLEKERSKNADPRTKDKRYGTKKKSIRFDVSSEATLSKDSGTS